MAGAIAPRYGAVTIGNLQYAYQPNPDAALGGVPRTRIQHLEKLGSTTDFTFRLLQIIDKAIASVNHFFQHSALSNLSNKASAGWVAVSTFPRIYCAAKETVDSYREIGKQIESPDSARPGAHEATPEQQKRRLYNFTSRLTDMAATVSFSVGLLAEQAAKAAGLAKNTYTLADSLWLVSDTCDARNAAQDWKWAQLAARNIESHRNPANPDQIVEQAPADLAQAVVQTQRLSLIKLAKSVMAMVVGILSLGSALFSASLISGFGLGVLALASASLAMAAMVYKQAMPAQPLDFLNYYNPNLAVQQPRR